MFIDTLLIFQLIVLIFSVMIHEIAHGSVAYSLGDHTAKNEGRLTLNPIKHVDLFGSIILPFFLLLSSVFSGGQGIIFGWAKPVPINERNFRDQKWGMLKVAIAGPATNFAVAIFFGLLIRFFNIPIDSSFFQFISIIILYNFSLGIFNLIPIPPLDGSHILLSIFPIRSRRAMLFLQQYGLLILVFILFSGGFYFINDMLVWFFSLVTGLG